jgi:hypothetical protein
MVDAKENLVRVARAPQRCTSSMASKRARVTPVMNPTLTVPSGDGASTASLSTCRGTARHDKEGIYAGGPSYASVSRHFG